MNTYIVWRLQKFARFFITVIVFLPLKIILFIPSEINQLISEAMFRMERW